MTFTSPQSTTEMPMAPHRRAGNAIVEPRPGRISGTATVHLACPLA